MPTAPSRSSTKRWRRATASAIARSKRNCIGREAKSCSSATPPTPRPAEEAFLTAIAVAKQQGTRSFELRAALPLAKLYQSTERPADAHAVPRPRARRLFADAQKCRRSPRRRRCWRRSPRPTRSRPRPLAATAMAASADGLRQRADRALAATARRKRRQLSSEARGSAIGRGGRFRTAGGRLRLMGRQLRPGRAVGHEEPTRGMSSVTVEARPQSGEAGLPIAEGNHALVRRRVSRGARPSGKRAGLVPILGETTISPFALDGTPACCDGHYLARHFGRWATSDGRFPSFSDCADAARAACRISATHATTEYCTRLCSN